MSSVKCPSFCLRGNGLIRVIAWWSLSDKSLLNRWWLRLATPHNVTESKRSSIWQLCFHWWHRKLWWKKWHRKLSLQLTVPPVMTKLSNRPSFVFSGYMLWYGYIYIYNVHIDRLVQERRDTIANALELRLSCTNPSIWTPRNVLTPDGVIHGSTLAQVMGPVQISEWMMTCRQQSYKAFTVNNITGKPRVSTIKLLSNL